MIAVLAEDRSDAETLVQLIKRILNNDRAAVHGRGFGGCGELRRKGAAHATLLRDKGACRFVIWHDADGTDPAEIVRQVNDAVINRAGLGDAACVVVPVQEIEAWILADEVAIAAVIPSLRLTELRHPESLDHPKEWLTDASRVRSARRLYAHTVHNARIASHLDLEKVSRKCPSFRPLVECVTGQ